MGKNLYGGFFIVICKRKLQWRLLLFAYYGQALTKLIEPLYTERLILNYIIEKINDYIEKINILWYH